MKARKLIKRGVRYFTGKYTYALWRVGAKDNPEVFHSFNSWTTSNFSSEYIIESKTEISEAQAKINRPDAFSPFKKKYTIIYSHYIKQGNRGYTKTLFKRVETDNLAALIATEEFDCCVNFIFEGWPKIC